MNNDVMEFERQRVLIHLWDLLTTTKEIKAETMAKSLKLNINFIWSVIHKDKLKNIILRHNKHPNQLAYNPNT